MKKTLAYLRDKKKNGRPIIMVTAYDFPTARAAEEAGIDAVLVGDSVGTTMLGYASEREVTMEDMLHHVAAAARGIRQAFFFADMPYRSADTPHRALQNARMLIKKGAECVKIEGWREKCPVVACLTKKNMPVCAHIGYNPQIHGAKPRVFGAGAEEARELIESARLLEQAGAILLILEKVPEEIAGIISKKLRIPVIGIGSGRLCDGQVLVVNDVLGISERSFRHARAFSDFRVRALGALRAYAAAVENRSFPAEEHVRHSDPQELALLKSSR
ncbi:MAG: 3-methyl-2-oxobutanoate hydroxymethyltransferase [Chitinispirillaceae bacterium]|nr:3-methyl-2-oxobutanoate hydroxymethyltransferase [Chitinispirillaceae bacterium]